MSAAASTRPRRTAWSKLTVRGVGAVTLIVFLVGIGSTGYGAHQLRSDAARSEQQRLRERAQQTTALVGSVAKTIQTVLTTASAIAGATEGNREAFRQSVRQPLADTPLLTNAVLVDLAGGRVRIDTVVGRKPVSWEAAAPCARAGSGSWRAPAR